MRNLSRLRRSRPLAACAALSLAVLAGCHHADPLVGDWNTTLPIGPKLSAQMGLNFKADGTETQTITMPGQNIVVQAKYTVKDSTLTTTNVSTTRNGQTLPTGTTTTLTFKIDGDTLTLSAPNSPRPLIFHRKNG